MAFIPSSAFVPRRVRSRNTCAAFSSTPSMNINTRWPPSRPLEERAGLHMEKYDKMSRGGPGRVDVEPDAIAHLQHYIHASSVAASHHAAPRAGIHLSRYMAMASSAGGALAPDFKPDKKTRAAAKSGKWAPLTRRLRVVLVNLAILAIGTALLFFMVARYGRF